MPLHAGARFHAFVNGLFRPKEEGETWRLYTKVERLLNENGLADQEGRTALATRLALDVAEAFGLPAEHSQVPRLAALVLELLDYEGLFQLPRVDWDERHTIAEHFDLRAELKRQRSPLEDFDGSYVCIRDTLTQCLYPLYDAPMPNSRDGLSFTVSLLGGLSNAGAVLEGMILAFFSKEVKERELFTRLREQLDDNLILASGGDPSNPKHANRAVRMPEQSKIKDPEELCDTYLGGTPLRRLLNQELTISISDQTRFEHTHILGGTGHGKTQLLQYMIHYDLMEAEEYKQSVVVIDSQGDLIRKLSRLKLLTGPLADRLLIIDPADIEHPPALNLFDAGLDRLESYTPHQRELAFNSLVDIYGRFFGSLLGAELTAKQGSVFRYIARLMLTIKGATIHTMIELMDSVKPFEKYIQKLDPTAKRFFEHEFSRSGFNSTRQQIKQRLYTILSIPTFDRLFSAPRSKVNFFDVLNEGSVVLVSTAKDLLKTDGAAIFGRFILSLIEHAIMERATLQENERTPTFLYVDEAQDYFDETIEALLIQGRKQHFGLIMAHQNLAQTSPRLNAVLAANTTIKFAGGISDKDARALASDMRTTANMLLSMKKRSSHTEFAISVRNQTPYALKVDILLGYLEDMEARTAEELAEQRERNWGRVCHVPEVTPRGPQPESVQEACSVAEPATAAPVSLEKAQEAPPSGHRALQERIANKAKKHGFAARVEYLLPNDKRVDVALFGHGLRVAVEVSVTNRESYELSNIEKALAYGFDVVWMVAPEIDHQERLKQFVRRRLPPSKWTSVLFAVVDDVISWIGKYAVPEQCTKYIAGYEVEVSFDVSPNANDRRCRQEQIKSVLLR
ncbi:type IV secretory system conjugative DNA transfer family protein [Kordiimonas marina]|uniref:type IV secretory system conjugative DNA transfer family protein n=1 Tax=Kordiimonas marina TaxID=2872312 RepID=UPI001FF68FA4|nr:type IV secretion system DNA-binding domain-containing protein [Kordiimonas marina]MCJ9430735.1 type IV secretion system DNA-binding domain-containing protein [Kordiimonas marina]